MTQGALLSPSLPDHTCRLAGEAVCRGWRAALTAAPLQQLTIEFDYKLAEWVTERRPAVQRLAVRELLRDAYGPLPAALAAVQGEASWGAADSLQLLNSPLHYEVPRLDLALTARLSECAAQAVRSLEIEWDHFSPAHPFRERRLHTAFPNIRELIYTSQRVPVGLPQLQFLTSLTLEVEENDYRSQEYHPAKEEAEQEGWVWRPWTGLRLPSALVELALKSEFPMVLDLDALPSLERLSLESGTGLGNSAQLKSTRPAERLQMLGMRGCESMDGMTLNLGHLSAMRQLCISANDWELVDESADPSSPLACTQLTLKGRLGCLEYIGRRDEAAVVRLLQRAPISELCMFQLYNPYNPPLLSPAVAEAVGRMPQLRVLRGWHFPPPGSAAWAGLRVLQLGHDPRTFCLRRLPEASWRVSAAGALC